jgi:ABC-type transport system involved in multi-copper enzyme maturation permease subunit
MSFLALILGTLREAIAKKIFIGFFAISTIIILVFLFVVNVDSVEGMVDVMGSSGDDAMKHLVIGFQIVMLEISHLLIITFCLISVSSFIPSMLEKGNIDLLLSKPISRANIILGKFTGGVILVFLSVVYLIGFVWLILSAKSGYWHFPFLYSILWLTLSFAVIYSLVIFLGLTTRSTILTIIITLFLVFVITPFLAGRENIFTIINNDVIKFIINFFYYIFPKPLDIDKICANIITGEPIKSYQPLITSLLFMIAMLSVSILYFKKKDY